MCAWRDDDVILKNDEAECTPTHAKLLKYGDTVVAMHFVNKQPGDSRYIWIGYIFVDHPQCNVFGVMLIPSDAYSEHIDAYSKYIDADSEYIKRPVTCIVYCYPATLKYFVDIPARFTLTSLMPVLAQKLRTPLLTLSDNAHGAGNLLELADAPRLITLRWKDQLMDAATCVKPAVGRRFTSVIRTFLLVTHDVEHVPMYVYNYHTDVMENEPTVHNCNRMKDFAECPPDRSVHFFPNVFHYGDMYYAVGVDVYERSIELRDIYKWDITAYVKQYNLADFVDTKITLYDHTNMPANTLLLLSHHTDMCLYYTLHTDGICRRHTDFKILIQYGGCMQWSMSPDKIAQAIGLGEDITRNILTIHQQPPPAERVAAVIESATSEMKLYPGGCVAPVEYGATCSDHGISAVILHGNRIFLSTAPTYLIHDGKLAATFATAVGCEWFRAFPKDVIQHIQQYCDILVPYRVMGSMIDDNCGQCRIDTFYNKNLYFGEGMSAMLYPSLMMSSDTGYLKRMRYYSAAHAASSDSADSLPPLANDYESDGDLPPLEDTYDDDSLPPLEDARDSDDDSLPPLEDARDSDYEFDDDVQPTEMNDHSFSHLPVDYFLSVQDVRDLYRNSANSEK